LIARCLNVGVRCLVFAGVSWMDNWKPNLTRLYYLWLCMLYMTKSCNGLL